MSEQPATPPGVPQWDTADRMRKGLRESGLGVTEMAVYLGVSRNTVGNWLNGNLREVQELLGHASITSTEVYTLVEVSASAATVAALPVPQPLAGLPDAA